jgi:uncharacterized protein (DUF4415 family)
LPQGQARRPIKRPATVRIDADILAWLKGSGPGYQTRINTLLRQALQPIAARRKKRNP